MVGDPIVDKHILDIIARNPSADVEVSKVKIKAPSKKALGKEKEIIVVEKTIKKAKKRRNTKRKSAKKKAKKVVKPAAEKHVKELKEKVKKLQNEQKKHATVLKKEVKKTHEELKKQLHQVHRTVEEGKNIYVPEPRPSLENQMIIESMNRLTGVVKQLVVLFNHKIAKEEGPLFAKLNEITEQNEKIAQGILTVADMLEEQETKPAQIRPINPYKPRLGPVPQNVQPQVPSVQEVNQNIMPPPDLGMYQAARDGAQQTGQPFMGPVPQNTAPMPPNEKPIGPKRMLF
jgi:myosin heavy subunit